MNLCYINFYCAIHYYAQGARTHKFSKRPIFTNSHKFLTCIKMSLCGIHACTFVYFGHLHIFWCFHAYFISQFSMVFLHTSNNNYCGMFAGQCSLPQGDVYGRAGAPPLSKIGRREESVAGEIAASRVSQL